MAKRISFISPIDHLSGNLSGKQDLKYALNDNPAFEAPEGKQYARNYKPRFVGTYRASNGTSSFQVRTKTATNIKPGTKLVMASLGAAASLAEVIMGKSSTWTTLKANIQASFDAGFKSGDITEKSAKTWLTAQLREMFVSKSQSIQLPDYSHPGVLLSHIYNQFVVEQWDSERDPKLPDRILIKFWTVLSPTGWLFKVNGMTGLIMFPGQTFGAIITGDGINVLGLKKTQSNHITTSDDLYLLNSDNNYVVASSYIYPNNVFGTTSEAPE